MRIAACASTVDAAGSGARERAGAAGSGAVTGIDPGDGNADADSGTASTAGVLIEGGASSRGGREPDSVRAAASYAGGVGAGRVCVWRDEFEVPLLLTALLFGPFVFGALLFVRSGPVGAVAGGVVIAWAPRGTF